MEDKYIIITSDGETYSPDGDEIENCQVLYIGSDASEFENDRDFFIEIYEIVEREKAEEIMAFTQEGETFLCGDESGNCQVLAFLDPDHPISEEDFFDEFCHLDGLGFKFEEIQFTPVRRIRAEWVIEKTETMSYTTDAKVRYSNE